MLRETYSPPIAIANVTGRVPRVSVTLQRYDGDQWCWAACVSMVLVASKSPRKPKSQCAIAAMELGKEVCTHLGTIILDYNWPRPVDRIARIWKDWDVQASQAGGMLTFKELGAQLGERRPVEIFLSDNCKDGHLVLIVDLFEDLNGRYVVTIVDPVSDGCLRWAYFDAIGQALGRGRWCDSWTNLSQV